jgi:hypothetical protein
MRPQSLCPNLPGLPIGPVDAPDDKDFDLIFGNGGDCGMFHGVSSYFYALTKNENTAAAEMGNFTWFFGTTELSSKPTDCTAFWGIRSSDCSM